VGAIGRDAELAAVAAGLAASSCRSVLVEGPAGIGKSTVDVRTRAELAAAWRK
jgi:MoxR-like ATPase